MIRQIAFFTGAESDINLFVTSCSARWKGDILWWWSVLWIIGLAVLSLVPLPSLALSSSSLSLSFPLSLALNVEFLPSHAAPASRPPPASWRGSPGWRVRRCVWRWAIRVTRRQPEAHELPGIAQDCGTQASLWERKAGKQKCFSVFFVLNICSTSAKQMDTCFSNLYVTEAKWTLTKHSSVT